MARRGLALAVVAVVCTLGPGAITTRGMSVAAVSSDGRRGNGDEAQRGTAQVVAGGGVLKSVFPMERGPAAASAPAPRPPPQPQQADASSQTSCQIYAVHLRANYRRRPYVDADVVALSWELRGAGGPLDWTGSRDTPTAQRSTNATAARSARNATQSAYRITACDAAWVPPRASPAAAAMPAPRAAVVWSTGVVASSETVGIIYEGPRRPGLRIAWLVEVWDGDGVGPCAAGNLTATAAGGGGGSGRSRGGGGGSLPSGSPDDDGGGGGGAVVTPRALLTTALRALDADDPDASSNVSNPSASWFEFAFLGPDDWHGAAWLTRGDYKTPTPPRNECAFYEPNPTFQVRYALDAAPPRGVAAGVTAPALTAARLYVAGLGYARVLVDGVQLSTAGDDDADARAGPPRTATDRASPSAAATRGTPTFFDPPISDYRRRVYYNVYNVTRLLAAAGRGAAVRRGRGERGRTRYESGSTRAVGPLSDHAELADMHAVGGTTGAPAAAGGDAHARSDTTLRRPAGDAVLRAAPAEVGDGLHQIAVELADGWYNPKPLRFWGRKNLRDVPNATGVPKCKVMIALWYSDGSRRYVVSKAGEEGRGEWTTHNTSTVFNNLYLGEVFDNTHHFGGTGGVDAAGVAIAGAPAIEAPPFAAGDASIRLQAATIPPITQQGPPLPVSRISRHHGHDPPCGVDAASVLVEKSPPASAAGRPNEVLAYTDLLDTGRNHAGTCRFTATWPAGAPANATARVFAKYGEFLNADGCVNYMTQVAGQIKGRNPNAPCQPEVAYTRSEMRLRKRAPLGTLDTVVWMPVYSWAAHRYIELNVFAGDVDANTRGGASGVVVPDVSVECIALRSDFDDALVGFDTSDAKLRGVMDLGKNTFDSNMMGMQSDCPGRERFGYGGDALGVGEALLTRYDLAAWHAKRAVDFADAQRGNGGYTETAPFVGIADGSLAGGDSGPVGWAAYLPAAAVWMYKYHANVAVLPSLLPSLLRFAGLLDTDPPGLRAGLGDWMPLEPTSTAFTGLFFQHATYTAIANISMILGNATLAADCAAKAAAVRTALHAEFYNGSAGVYTTGGLGPGGASQTGQALAIYEGLAPVPERAKVLSVLVEAIQAAEYVAGQGEGPERGGAGPHMLAGMFGIKCVLGSLSEYGRSDLALEVLTQPSYPSLYWMMHNEYANGTTVWESWFFSDSTYSHNHPMFASGDQWVVQHLLGVMPAPDARGFSTVLIRPRPPLLMARRSPTGTASLAGWYRTVRGPVGVAWVVEADTRRLSVAVSVPPNTRAVVCVPGLPTTTVGSGAYEYRTTL